MKLIVGLGNPGTNYKNTRHNIGFIFLDNYLEKLNLINYTKKGFKSEYIKKDEVFFQKPLTYMNNSGQAISELANYYKIKPNNIYVIYDDMDMEIGKIRIRDQGSSGGHNGIKSILSHVGNDFIRIKIGIGKKKNDTIEHVLGSFSLDEFEIINSKKEVINNLIDDIINDIDLEKLKTKYNNK
ncbi:aminoacyl-tRNA hydrolase [Oceanivirga salmonicida]|uniref:aminoacyl-tRNA hydrolase n=1 Tax=Oceanivirga salmonicida TaxID=1769291 RepID=UPI00083277DE|nr:aminoacyl-tRNA hydrolase [Oceanivirga salmonicida]